MKHINIEECIAQIDESRIERDNDANVYVSADNTHMVLAFAYSERMEDEFIIVSISEKEKEFTFELWAEFLAAAIYIRDMFNVELLLDDVRFDDGITEKMIETIEKEVSAID